MIHCHEKDEPAKIQSKWSRREGKQRGERERERERERKGMGEGKREGERFVVLECK